MILVAGATGSLGGRIVDGLIRAGMPVRALARPGADVSGLRGAGVEIFTGDLREPASLSGACAGVDVVISTASATRRGDDDPANVDARGTQHLIDAAHRAGAAHFILVSTLGASEDSPVPAFRAKAAAERHLRDSGLRWTVLQPNAFMDVWFGMLIEMPLATGMPVTLVGEARRRHGFVAERDVAAFAIAAITNAAAHDATIYVGGPEAVTFRDVVAAYEHALGRSIPTVFVAPGDPIPGLPEPVWGIAAALDTFDSDIPMQETARTFGVDPTTVRAFARASPLARHPG